jgi:hypothetical protein
VDGVEKGGFEFAELDIHHLITVINIWK